MGWNREGGLGKKEEGIIEPIRLGMTLGKLGVGKMKEDDQYTENLKRPEMAIETVETQEMAQKREILVEKQSKLEDELIRIKDTFRCDLCSKQYTNAMEYQQHLDSYDHNHKKRFIEMKQMTKKSEPKRVANSQKVDKAMEDAMAKAQKASQSMETNRPQLM
eukprot:TRINITY_DN3246_c0_g1_i4.p1 TRINITY_DN3246_c0_g1~~TRINITY_DN3246_c0_g1_i4.p1  ORF type:complete len:162 (-),score=32.57 TRINITY_DN3246_c0_g1_i4:140-625(-)